MVDETRATLRIDKTADDRGIEDLNQVFEDKSKDGNSKTMVSQVSIALSPMMKSEELSEVFDDNFRSWYIFTSSNFTENYFRLKSPYYESESFAHVAIEAAMSLLLES
uniref:Uncharacterized protein n=1 Tax=Timema shepardi TaxID=629360 RepID=A0A7R9ANU9_TIMSH|nr:unnamed protein product [Timema shepardi]